MNKSKLISIMLLILLAVFVSGCAKKPQIGMKNQDGSGKQSGDEVESFTGSLQDLLKMGRSVKCTGSMSTEDGTIEVVAYSSGKKYYSESTISGLEEMGTIKSYAIFDGEWMYSWSDYGFAMKMKASDMEDMSNDMAAQGADTSDSMQKAKEFQKEFDYKCRPWIADNSKFTPPSDIEFADMAETMNELNEYMESDDYSDIKERGCEACEMYGSAEEIAECKAKLRCE